MIIKRLFARYIDNILIFVLSILIGVIVFNVGKLITTEDLAANASIISFIIGFICIYTIDYVILTKRTGMSIGKRLLGIKLVNDNKSNLTYSKVFIRELILQTIASIGGIGFIFLLVTYFSSENRLLHDSIFKTNVIKKS